MITDDRVDAEARQYVERVRAALGDVPPDELDELMADLTGHLADVAARGESIADRLGPPERYATDLRASAGLGDPPAPAPRHLELQARAIERWRRSAPARWLRPWEDELRHAWWVGRAWLAVAWLGSITSVRDERVVPAVAGSRLIGSVVLVAAIGVSLRIGRLPDGRARRLAGGALGGAAVVGALVLATHRPTTVIHEPFAVPSGPSTADGRTLLNVFAFDEEGNLLERVYLYDQDGQPLLTVDEGAALPVDAAGAPIANVYPQHPVTQDPATGEYRVGALATPSVLLPRPGPDGAFAVSYETFGYGASVTMPPYETFATVAAPSTAAPEPSGPGSTTPSTTTPTTTTTTPVTTTPTTTAPSPTTVSSPTTVPTTTPATVPPTTVPAPATTLVPALDPRLPPVQVPAG